MKRARGRNSANQKKQSKYEDINVPESVRPSADERRYINATVVDSGIKKGKKKKTKKSRKKKIRNFILFIILAAIVIFLAAMGMGWGNSDDEGALIPVDMEAGKLNVLLLGVDNEGLRTDAMMLVSYNFKENKANIMSIPRDTQIKVTDRNVVRKINEIHAMHDSDNNLIGPMGSIKAVTAITSVPIHYYAEFSFKAIDELADILGPIEFDVPDIEGNGKGMNYDDPAQDLHIHLKPGLQKLSGNQVQQFLRYRKSNNGTADGSDISRVERQQEFVRAAIDQKVNLSLIAKLPSIYSKLKKNIKTNFSTGDIVKYSKYLNGITGDALTSFSLPGASKRTSKGWYFICDLDETAQLITQNFGYEASELTTNITIDDIKGTKKVLTSSEKNSSKNTQADSGTSKSENTKPSDEQTAAPKSEKTKTPESKHDIQEDDTLESSDYDYDNGDVISDDKHSDKIISTPQKTHNASASGNTDNSGNAIAPDNSGGETDDSESDDVITLD